MGSQRRDAKGWSWEEWSPRQHSRQRRRRKWITHIAETCFRLSPLILTLLCTVQFRFSFRERAFWFVSPPESGRVGVFRWSRCPPMERIIHLCPLEYEA